MNSKEDLRQKISREIIFQIFSDGTIGDVSKNVAFILGYTQEEMIGENILELIKDDRKDQILDGLKKNLRMDLIHKNGSHIYMDIKKETIVNQNKEKLTYISIIDISPLKEEFERSQRLMRICESADDIIYSYNVRPKFKFNYLSPSVEKNLGYTVKEHYDRPSLPLDIVHPDDRELHIKKLEGGANYLEYYQTRFKHKNGNYSWFEEYIVPVVDENNEVTAVEGITRNIQKRKEEYEQLKMYSTIFENLLQEFRKYKHDFSNLLLPLRGYIDEKKYDKLEEYFYSEILTQQEKINSDYQTYMPIRYIKSDGLKGLIISKVNKAISNNIKVDIQVFQDINNITINTKELCEVMGILFDNAIEASVKNDDKIILFSIIEDEEETSIIISNTFKDMPNINRMFEKGYTTKAGDGGYGLFIVRDIIDRYDNIILNTMINDDMIIQELIIENSKVETFI